MDLTIVIVNWNGGELLHRCLASIRASRQSFPVRVIVVDNDSSDGSREAAAAEFPEFKVVNSGGNLGFGRANNLARPLVDTPLVLFLNPDTELRVDTLEKCVACLRARPDVGALGCKMVYPDGRVQEQGLQWLPTPWTILLEMLLASRSSRRWFRRWLPFVDPLQSAYLSKLYGGFILAPKDVLDRAGWFDDRYFMYAEDVDLSRTITGLGLKLYYCAEAEIIHVAGGTSAKAPGGFSILMKSRSVNQYLRKYHGGMGAFLHRVVVCVGALFRQFLLLLLWLPGRLRGAEAARAWGHSWFKQRLLLLWALGLKKPVIATGR
jgi:GT2 family glycosyltransferase